MGFHYVNPGFAGLLDVTGGATVQTSERSRTGYGILQPKDRCGVKLGTVRKELYLRFDFYLPTRQETDRELDMDVRYNGYGLNIYCRKNSESALFYVESCIPTYGENPRTTTVNKSDLDKLKTECCLFPGKVNAVYMHIKHGSGEAEDGELEIWFNGTLYMNRALRCYTWNDSYVVIKSSSEPMLISGIIISDTAFDKRTRLVQAPVAGIESEKMTRTADGSYIATDAGQTLLQHLDMEALAASYGGNSHVTGVAVIGNPAYQMESGGGTLTGIQSLGGSLTEYATQPLQSDAAGVICDYHLLDGTVDGLNGLAVGWKTGV